MKKYRFAYTETNEGVIEVKANNKKEAWELAQSLDGDIHIFKSDWEIDDIK